MDFISFFPQYCAVRTVAPEPIPNNNKIKINCIWLASEEADKVTSLYLPSIITSVLDMATLIKFCIAIGSKKASTVFLKEVLSNIFLSPIGLHNRI